MMLFRDLSGNGEVFYLIEDHFQNKNLWNKDTTLRDNVVVTIGTCFAAINPKPITKYMPSDIPLIVANNSVIVLKTPLAFPTTSINNYIITSLTRSFCIEQM